MPEAVIIDAVRTPIARGKPIVGELNGLHPTEVLGKVYAALVERNGLSFEDIEQVYAGCVTQAGEQSNNIARNAWLAMGKNYSTGATSMDTQCGSAMAAIGTVDGLIQANRINIGIGSGVEMMSRVGLGQNAYNGPGFFQPAVWPWDSTLNQFEAAERIAKNRGITRDDINALAVESQRRAKIAWDEGRFNNEVIKVEAPIIGEDGQPTGQMRIVERDQGLRETTMEGLAGLKPVMEGGIHTAGTSSQISDGAAGVLLMSAEEAKARGLKPRARILATTVSGADPYYLLDGPVDATRDMFKRTGMKMSDIDLFEVNEAFAAVVLSWARVYNADLSKVNVNGGAMALGHPVGSTGARMLATALNELERQDKTTALLTMCCGASIGTGIIIERI
ncbi:MAG TPA: steroid 3-ketoacyl-CoA thiolase [Pseudomonadales bacterium]